MALASTCAGRSGTQGNPLTCWSEKVVVRLGLYLVGIVSKRASEASKWDCDAAGPTLTLARCKLGRGAVRHTLGAAVVK